MANFFLCYKKGMPTAVILIAFGASLELKFAPKMTPQNGLQMTPQHFGPKLPCKTAVSEAPRGVCGTR